MPEEPTSDTFTFDYTVNNGTTAKNGRATAKVTVRVVGSGVNTPPKLRAGQGKLATSTYPVVAGNPVRVGVVADWRDAENDPHPGLGRRPGRRRASTARAPSPSRPAARRASRSSTTSSTTAAAASTPSTVTLDVLSEDETKAVPPRTQPDVLRGVVGKPVQLQPLGNDIAGADPTDPQARMRLAQAVARPRPADHRHQPRHQRAHRDRPVAGHHDHHVCRPGRLRGQRRSRARRHPARPVGRPAAGRDARQRRAARADAGHRRRALQRLQPAQRRARRAARRHRDAWLRASIVQGRWIRVEATAPLERRHAATRRRQLHDQRRHQGGRRPALRRAEAAAQGQGAADGRRRRRARCGSATP